MSFSNHSMKQKHTRLVAPHIAKIEGLWRVSPKPVCVYGSPHWQRWRDAHEWAAGMNAKLLEKQFWGPGPFLNLLS